MPAICLLQLSTYARWCLPQWYSMLVCRQAWLSALLKVHGACVAARWCHELEWSMRSRNSHVKHIKRRTPYLGHAILGQRVLHRASYTSNRPVSLEATQEAENQSRIVPVRKVARGESRWPWQQRSSAPKSLVRSGLSVSQSSRHGTPPRMPASDMAECALGRSLVLWPRCAGQQRR